MSNNFLKVPFRNYSKNTSIIVIGAGLAGASIAKLFKVRGFNNIMVVEKNARAADAASGNDYGILMPLIGSASDPIAKFYSKAFCYSVSEIENKIINGIIEITPRNLIKELGSTAVADLAAKLSSEEASDILGLKINSEAIYFESAALVSPKETCLQMLEGVEVIYNCDIARISKDNGIWCVYGSDSGQLFTSEIVIIANSYEALKFEQTSFLEIKSVKGQITKYPGNTISSLLRKPICYGGYITPLLNGSHYIGATYELEASSAEVTYKANIENLNHAAKYFDFIRSSDYGEFEARAAFRGVASDRRPIIGLVPDLKSFNKCYKDLYHGRNIEDKQGDYNEGLYVSLAHGSRGLSSCPYAARILCDLIVGDDILEKEFYNLVAPSRFIIRNLKRGVITD